MAIVQCLILFLLLFAQPAVASNFGTATGGGSGDMTKAVYDNDTDNTVDDAEDVTCVGCVADAELASTFVKTESDPIVGAINGIVKADGGGNISAATGGVDYVAAETDPQVNNVTASKICKGSGTQVDCSDTDLPAGTTLNTAAIQTGVEDDTPDDDSEVPDNITVNPINATTETAIETVVDLQDLQGAVTDGQVPDNITITETDPNALLTAGTDNVKDTHIDWGTGASQVSADDIPDGATNAIPTLTQESNWDTAFGWNDHSLAGYAVSGGAEHDGFSDYVAAEHINWTVTQAPTVIHADNYTDTNTTYTAGGVLLDLTGTVFSVNVGTLTTTKGCKYVSGTGLVCDQDYITSETDPEVGAVTANKICIADGDSIECDGTDLPAGTTINSATIQTGTDDDIPEAGDYSNFTAGRSLSHGVTGTITADDETYQYRSGIAFEDPTDTDDFFFDELHKNVTFTSIYCKTNAGTVTLDVTHGGTDIEGTDIVCDSDGQADAGISSASGVSGEEIALAITSVASTPGYVMVRLNGTYDD